MVTLPLHNLLRLKSRDSYIPKGSVDEIQSNGLMLLVEWRESCWLNNLILDRVATRKRKLNAEKIRTSLL